MDARLLIVAALGACYAPTIGDCQYACAAGDEPCPSGLSCIDQVCRAPGATQACEAKPLDAAIDGDGLHDAAIDAFVGDHDEDGDGVPNGSDNCPTVANASQAHAGDTDAVGDACDPVADATPDSILYFAPFDDDVAPLTATGNPLVASSSVGLGGSGQTLVTPDTGAIERDAVVRFRFVMPSVTGQQLSIHATVGGLYCSLSTTPCSAAPPGGGCLTQRIAGSSSAIGVDDIGGLVSLEARKVGTEAFRCRVTDANGVVGTINAAGSVAFAPTQLSFEPMDGTSVLVSSVIVYTR